MYFVKSIVKWYARTGGTYKKQINLKINDDFADNDPVYVIKSQDFEKHFNPELIKENDALKQQVKNLQKEIDEIADKDASNEIADEIILSEFKNQMQNQIDKNAELQQQVNDLNDKLHHEKDKMIDIQTFNSMLMQEINRKNHELTEYQNDVETCTSDLAKAIQDDVIDKYNKRSAFKKLLNKKPDDLNDGLDDIIKQHTPTKTHGFLEIPINVDENDVRKYETNDNKDAE